MESHLNGVEYLANLMTSVTAYRAAAPSPTQCPLAPAGSNTHGLAATLHPGFLSGNIQLVVCTESGTATWQ
jgi:hypothetical protein